jgi:hypothetical protein
MKYICLLTHIALANSVNICPKDTHELMYLNAQIIQYYHKTKIKYQIET